MQAVIALAILRPCASLSEALLVNFAINTKNSSAGQTVIVSFGLPTLFKYIVVYHST